MTILETNARNERPRIQRGAASPCPWPCQVAAEKGALHWRAGSFVAWRRVADGRGRVVRLICGEATSTGR